MGKDHPSAQERRWIEQIPWVAGRAVAGRVAAGQPCAGWPGKPLPLAGETATADGWGGPIDVKIVYAAVLTVLSVMPDM